MAPAGKVLNFSQVWLLLSEGSIMADLQSLFENAVKRMGETLPELGPSMAFRIDARPVPAGPTVYGTTSPRASADGTHDVTFFLASLLRDFEGGALEVALNSFALHEAAHVARFLMDGHNQIRLDGMSDAAEVQRLFHGPDFCHMAARIAARGRAVGVPMSAGLVLHGCQPAARNPSAYLDAARAERCVFDSLLLDRPPSPQFSSIWLADLKAEEPERLARVKERQHFEDLALGVVASMYLPATRPTGTHRTIDARRRWLDVPMPLPAMMCGCGVPF